MRTCPPDFNMASLHPSFGCTLLQWVLLACTCTEGGNRTFKSGDDVEKGLELTEWLIEQGADPMAEVPESSEFPCFEGEPELNETELDIPNGHKVNYAGKSAISFLLEARDKMTEDHVDKLTLATLDKLLDVFTKNTRAGACRSQRVDSGVIETWDKMLRDEGSHDVVLKTSTQPATAHSCILSIASPVLAAMLASEFREGVRKHIDVTDRPAAAMSLLLELAYTGAASSALNDVAVVLAALDLAHRWQMQNVVDMLERALQNNLSDEAFSRIAEAATLKGLHALKTSCIGYARSSAGVQADIANGQLPNVVLKLLGRSSPPAKKRRFL